jgi:hypothetical protein
MTVRAQLSTVIRKSHVENRLCMMMQLIQVKINGMLIEGEALSCNDKSGNDR